MNVLFVYRGYSKSLSNPVVDFQAKSLINKKINIIRIPLASGGYWGYIQYWFTLRQQLKSINIDLIHAHYSLSGFIAAFTFKKPVICSLLGSDLLRANIFWVAILKIFTQFFWSKVIVKSAEMQAFLPTSLCIPNGIDMENFRPITYIKSTEVTGFSEIEKNIVFIAKDPSSKVKNFQLAHQAVELLNQENIKFHVLSDVSPEKLPFYYSSADILLLTSLSEGSPNVIKEAMACNCPIVSTDVGDVREVIQETEGCFITSYDPQDVADKIKLALAFGKRTNGRDKIRHLDNNIIAEKIIAVYKEAINKG